MWPGGQRRHCIHLPTDAVVFNFSWYVECIIIVHCAIDVVNCKMINDGDVCIMAQCRYNHFITGGLSRLVNAKRTNCRSVLHRFCDVCQQS